MRVTDFEASLNPVAPALSMGCHLPRSLDLFSERSEPNRVVRLDLHHDPKANACDYIIARRGACAFRRHRDGGLPNIAFNDHCGVETSTYVRVHGIASAARQGASCRELPWAGVSSTPAKFLE